MSNQLATQNDQPTELADTTTNRGLAFVNPNDMPDLDSAEIGMSIEKKYFEFVKEGDTVRAVFNGMDYITTNKEDAQGNKVQKQIPAIVFQNKQGVYLNSGASLVEQFKTIPAGTPVQIKYIGEVKTGSGNKVKKYDVNILNVSVKATAVTITKQDAPAPVKTDQKIIDAYWQKTYQMKMTNEEGLAHLAEFRNDYQVAFNALTGDFSESA